MKQKIRLGIACLARKTFDYNAAESLYKGILSDLEKLENVDLVAGEELVIEFEDARRTGERFASGDIDGLVCISGTFHLGHLVLEMGKLVKKPVLLWGLPELPYDGGKIRLNSVCGLNLNASNLYKAGIRNFHANLGMTIDTDWVDALRIIRSFASAHVGLAGFRAHGFFNFGVYDLDAYRQLGVLVDHYELSNIYSMSVNDGRVREAEKIIKEKFDVSGITGDQLEKVARLSAQLEVFMDENRISALAIRCWPEFAADYGVSPCAAMSLLQADNRIISCEGDVDGALSMLAHRALGAETPFLFDFSHVNMEDNSALLWHCGAAPCSLWDGKSPCSLDTYFAGGKGVTADFVLKEGEVSIVRLDSAGGEYRIFLQKARGVNMEKELKGTYLKVYFDGHVRDVLEKIIYNGIAHHASMVYGDFIRPFEILARIKGWKTIQ